MDRFMVYLCPVFTVTDFEGFGVLSSFLHHLVFVLGFQGHRVLWFLGPCSIREDVLIPNGFNLITFNAVLWVSPVTGFLGCSRVQEPGKGAQGPFLHDCPDYPIHSPQVQ